MNKNYTEIFSKNLRYYMKIQNKTRNDIVNDLGIPYTSIRDYEKGICRAKMDKIEKLADYFNIPTYKLTEPQNTTEVMNIVDNSEDSKIILEIMIKASQLSLERKKYILKTIDMVSNDK